MYVRKSVLGFEDHFRYFYFIVLLILQPWLYGPWRKAT